MLYLAYLTGHDVKIKIKRVFIFVSTFSPAANGNAKFLRPDCIRRTGTFYVLPVAYDVDSAQYSVIRYELMSDDNATITSSSDDVTDDVTLLPFRLESVRRDDLTFDLRLIVIRPIDREVHRLPVISIDHSCIKFKRPKGYILKGIAIYEKPISKLRSVTCHMGSHSVTCYPTQVNTLRINSSQTVWYSIIYHGRI